MKPTRSLLLSCLLVIAAGHSVAASNNRRQGPGGIIPTTLPPPTPPTTTSPPPTPPTTTHSDTEPAPDTNTSRSTQSTPPTPTPSTDPPPPDTQTRPPSTTQQQPPTPTPTPSPPPQQITPTPTPSEVTSTDAQGGTVIVTVTNPPTSSSSSAAAPSQSAKNDDDDDSPALGTGSIVAISVAGGVAVIALGAFLVWKFTRKRFADFDDNEAIKWPDLNTHGGTADSHPLPVNSTGRAGFETGSEASLSRVPSSSYSTPDLAGGAQDPYAVPPLPHMNPNQPYRDDPTAATGYYDPYRGPVPGTLEHGASADDWAGEAIPMTQMAGRVSPGPQAAYGAANASSVGHGEYAQDYGHESYDVGRRSPGPQAAYGIQAGGRTGSPGPQAAYAAGGGRASPGPQAAYSTGRMSPGPQASYDQYGVPR